MNQSHAYGDPFAFPATKKSNGFEHQVFIKTKNREEFFGTMSNFLCRNTVHTTEEVRVF